MLDHVFQDLPIAQRIHRPPKAGMLVGHQQVLLDKPLKRFGDEFFAVVHVIEDGVAKQKEAAIDPDVRAVRRSELANAAAVIDIGKVIGQRRTYGDKAADFSAALEARDHVVEIDVAETVAVVRKKDFFVLNVSAHRPKSLADVAPNAGIEKRHAPVVGRRIQQLDVGRVFRNDAVGILMRLIVQKKIFDDVGFVAEAQNEIVMPVLAVIVHQMPQDRLVADRDHGLRDIFRVFPDAGAQAAAK